MVDRKLFEELLLEAFEAGRDQGMEDISSVLAGSAPDKTPEEGFTMFLMEKINKIEKITQG